MYLLKAVQTLPIAAEQAWSFFSSPHNLSVITPAKLRFEVKTELPAKIYPGLFIQYSVRPLFGIPLTWVTEITHVVENQYFVDEQRVGPYKIWHHEHHFKSVNDGVEMTDLVHFELPLGVVGRAFYPLLVRSSLSEIFSFRQRKLEELFGKIPGKPPVLLIP
jgi:ligand-binding SRPBCC domain-containing protein